MTRLRDERYGVLISVMAGELSLQNSTDRPWGPPSPLFRGLWVFFFGGVEWPIREVDHSPPYSVQDKN